MFCDMHIHSNYSDCTLTPKEIIDLAMERGLSAIALTDHNSVSGLPDFFKAGQGKSIDLVGGAEFSTEYMGTELHILGLFIPPEFYKVVEEFTDNSFKAKLKSNIDLCEKIRRTGVDITYDEVKATVNSGKVNRANIASVLVKKGYAETVQDAFEKYLYKKAGFYVPAKKPSSLEVIEFINKIGAVSVWAHPFLNIKDTEKMRKILADFKTCGLDGMEVNYPSYDEETTKKAVALAEEFSIIKSGGSDFHGDNKPHIALGTGKGNLAIPYSVYTELYSRYRDKHKV